MRIKLGLLALAGFLMSTSPLFAQDTPVGPEGTQVATEETPAAASNADELRKAAQNPIASLISVPFQENFNFGIGPADRTQNVLNIQPVIPISVSKDWNLVTRWITPVIYQPLPVPQPPGPPVQQTGTYGLGDLNPSFFLSPKKKFHGLIWGIGPTFVLPTATNTAYLGQGKLSIGPTFVALVQPSKWTLGFLTNNVWSVAGHSNADKPAVNQFLLQYFINYNMKKGYYLSWAPIITANWRAPSGNQWTVPVGGGVGRIMKLGFQPVNISAQFYRNAVFPTGTSPWGMKVSVALLFPKLTKKQEEMMMEQKLKQLKAEGAQQTGDTSANPPAKSQEPVKSQESVESQKNDKQDTPVGPEGTQVATEETPAAASNADELRKAAQNPIASLISVPFQENFNFGIGPADRTQNVLNIQPVIPISVTKDWNLVTRWITPVIYQPLPVPQPPGPPVQQTGTYGLGDLNPSFFLSPKKKFHGLIWGVGPTFVLPTATNTKYLGQGKLSIGPTFVALVQPSKWTLGFLTNNVWSVAGHSNADKPAVNQFLLQYFINYNMKKGYYLSWAPIITANWRAPSGNQWTVPVGGGVGRIMKLGFQPVNISAQFYRNAVFPTGTSPWGMKVSVALLFPKLTKKQEEMMMEQKLKQMQQEQPQKN